MLLPVDHPGEKKRRELLRNDLLALSPTTYLPYHLFCNYGKDKEIGDLRNFGCPPDSGCPSLLDHHTSLVYIDSLHLRPGKKFAPVADALLVHAERRKRQRLPISDRVEGTRNEFPCDTLDNRQPQFGDVLRQII